ncbi:MAG: sensor histidine kinase, partial [Alistipes sp.]|nr:sensor histidine kinase [Alistipes sp.]
MTIKTKEFASLLTAFVATLVVVAVMIALGAQWWSTAVVAVATYILMALTTLLIIRKYVAYKLKPIYSIVLSRDVHTGEIVDELKDKHVENIS